MWFIFVLIFFSLVPLYIYKFRINDVLVNVMVLSIVHILFVFFLSPHFSFASCAWFKVGSSVSMYVACSFSVRMCMCLCVMLRVKTLSMSWVWFIYFFFFFFPSLISAIFSVKQLNWTRYFFISGSLFTCMIVCLHLCACIQKFWACVCCTCVLMCSYKLHITCMCEPVLLNCVFKYVCCTYV